MEQPGNLLGANRAGEGPENGPENGVACRPIGDLTSPALADNVGEHWMKSNFATRLWNASPESLTRAIQRRLGLRARQAGWFKVKAGPLAGAELYLPTDKSESWGEMVGGQFDAFLYDALLACRSLKGAVCWDIGAHIGYHSLAFAALGGQVVAFEPNPHNVARLKLHLERNPALAPRVRLLPAALSDQDGEMTFVQSSDLDGRSSGSHLSAATPPLGQESYSDFERITVRTIRIDTLVEAGGEPVPDVIKTDVEGAETLVLKGGSRFFSRHQPILLMEVHHICLMFQVQQLLHDWGYDLRLLDEAHAEPSRCFVMATARATRQTGPAN